MNYPRALGILGVNPDFTNDSLKKEYKRLAMKYHPDKCKGTDSDKFVEINEAYTYLTKYNSENNINGIFENELINELNSIFKDLFTNKFPRVVVIKRQFVPEPFKDSFPDSFPEPFNTDFLKHETRIISPKEYLEGFVVNMSIEEYCKECNSLGIMNNTRRCVKCKGVGSITKRKKYSFKKNINLDKEYSIGNNTIKFELEHPWQVVDKKLCYLVNIPNINENNIPNPFTFTDPYSFKRNISIDTPISHGDAWSMGGYYVLFNNL